MKARHPPGLYMLRSTLYFLLSIFKFESCYYAFLRFAIYNFRFSLLMRDCKT
jgi:hypothetical protein